MNAVQCPTMAAASGLSETMTLDDDSGAHEGNDEDNGDDAYGIESHGEQDAIARQVQLLTFVPIPFFVALRRVGPHLLHGQSVLLAIGVRAVQISFPLASTSSGVMALLFLAGLRIAALLLHLASCRYTPEYTIKSLVVLLVHQLEVLLVALFHLCTQRLALLHFRTMLLDERVHVLLWFAQC